MKERLKKQNADRNIIFRNLVLNDLVRAGGEETKLFKPETLVGSKLIFDKMLNVSSELKECPQYFFDLIEWQRKSSLFQKKE